MENSLNELFVWLTLLGSVGVYVWYAACVGERYWNWLRLGLFAMTIINCLGSWLWLMVAVGKISMQWLGAVNCIRSTGSLVMLGLLAYVVYRTSKIWSNDTMGHNG